MRREWEPEELIASWTLVEDDWRLVGNKSGATRLSFALLLKFFELDARFPRRAGDVPLAAITYVASQVKVPAEAFAAYDWSGRTLKYHRAQIRTALGFREAGREDEDRLTRWRPVSSSGTEDYGGCLSERHQKGRQHIIGGT